MYKTSYYNFMTETDDSCLLLYNTKSGAFVSLPYDLKGEIDRIFLDPERSSDSELKEGLVHGGFLIPIEKNEKDEIRKRFFDFKTDRNSMVLTMLAAEDCNFKCPYCFIYKQRGMLMQDWVYEATLKMIERSATEEFYLRINFFGGEPTLSEEQNLRFMRELNQIADKKGFKKLTYSMITNGYLLTQEKAQQYVDSGMNAFQVTFDGDKPSHNQTRQLKDGSDTFDVIWENLMAIKNIEGDFEVSIRCNFLKGRDEEMQSLIARFAEHFGDDDRFILYFRPVYNFETSRDDICEIEKQIFSLEEGLYKQMTYNMQVASLKGTISDRLRMVNPVPKPIPAWCTTDKNNFWIVGADGLLFKCDTLLGDKSKASAMLQRDGSFRMLADGCTWCRNIYEDENNKCLNCKLLPVCHGGCARRRMNEPDSCYLNGRILKNAMKMVHKYHTDHGSEKCSDACNKKGDSKRPLNITSKTTKGGYNEEVRMVSAASV